MIGFEERFWSKVAIGDWHDCWPWASRANSRGYGLIWRDGKATRAHKVAYELLVGPVPEGMTLDHVHAWGCGNKACCNPLHLEPVTRQENHRRWYSLRTTCPQGHPYDKVTKQGTRACSICHREASRRHRRARK